MGPLNLDHTDGIYPRSIQPLSAMWKTHVSCCKMTHEGNLLQRDLIPLKRALDSLGDAGSHGDSRKQVSLVTGGPACRDCHRPSRGFLSDSQFLSY